jgi:subtilase family serine protease
MSFGDAEIPQEISFDQYFTQPGVVYFASSGDSGLGRSSYPTASPNVVSVGGTRFVRDGSGNFTTEQYYTGGGGGDISPYEPRPSYQDGIAGLVGNFRGYPDVAADYCCTSIYVRGSWTSVGGTSWSSPTFAGIVNAAGNLQKSSLAELTLMYNELADPMKYAAYFNDITAGDSRCKTGWDLCTGIGSPKTYGGK